MLDQDAAEHRNGGDRQRDATEQAVDGPVDARRERRGGEGADQEAECEGQRDGGNGHRKRQPAQARRTQPAELEAAADLEHQQDEADLAQDDDGRIGFGAEQRGGRPRKEMAEQRGAEQQAGDDLADRRRLADAAEQAADEAGGADHHDELEQHGEEKLLRLMDRRRHAQASTGGPASASDTGCRRQ